jgi:hypothetical protein
MDTRPELADVELEREPGSERGRGDVWEGRVSSAVLQVCSTGLFIARRGQGAGWPDCGRGMAVTWSSAISSARDGSYGMGSRCRWWGDVGGALAS